MPPRTIRRVTAGNADAKAPIGLGFPAKEDFCRRILEQAGDAMVVVEAEPSDEPGPRIVYVNKAFTAMTGYPSAELLEKSLCLLHGPHTDAKSKAALHHALERQEPLCVELVNYRKNGSEFWVELLLVPSTNAQGRVTHFIGVQRDVTERRRVEGELRAREDRFRQMADSMPQIVWTAQPDGTVDYCNQQWYAFTGVLPGTTGNEMWRDLIHPDDLVPANASWAAAVASGEPYGLEYRFRRASDGVYCWFLSRARAETDSSGRIVRWVGTSTEITERKRAEEAVEATAERLRLAIDAARLGPWEWNIEKGEVLWSPEHNAMYDIPREQSRGGFEEGMLRVHPDDRQAVIESMQTAMAEHRDAVTEMRSVHRDGSVHWLVTSGRTVYDETGNPLRMIGVVQDITERKTAEEALRQSEERFRLANIHSPFPVALVADNGEILQINAAWSQLSGYPVQELTSVEAWTRRAFPAEASRLDVQQFIGQLFDRRTPVEDPGRRIHCADGSERIWDFSSVSLGRLRDGRRLLLSTAIDVTERHQTDARLRAAKLEADAAKEAAEKAREEAEKANRAKGEFLSRMSHELRTPLNAILGFSQVLELGSLEDEDQQCVHQIHQGGKHLRALVDEVLDLARVEAGELALKPAALAFDKIGRECLSFVTRLAQANQVTCATKLEPGCDVQIWADEQRLRQMLFNLLSNAIKYNRPGGQVSLGCARTQDDRIRLSVTDTGEGIAPEGLARLFVPFERLGQEFGSVEGTGLGLVVSRRLAEAMGGRLGAESQVGVGSTFWIDLPMAPDASLKHAGSTGILTTDVAAAGQKVAATVLYIEDNASNLHVVQTVIGRLRPRWRLLSARDGASGLAQARTSLPTVILLDLELPEMKGDIVLGKLRGDPRTSRIPVLMLSADATAHSRERLLGLGVNAYVSKPFVVTELLEKLDGLISRARIDTPPGKRSRAKPPPKNKQ